MKTLKINNRYLSWNNGEPFFYLGDTAWELFHKLSREEMKEYFDQRQRQGFTAIQAVALAEMEGATVPNFYGRLPLKFTNEVPDPSIPDIDKSDNDSYTYWDHVDYAIALAAERNMFIAFLPTWGDKFNCCFGKGPEIFNEENAYIYAKWLANRYKESWNIIWMLGGDRELKEEHRKIIDAMGKAIKEVDPFHLITFHPPGGSESTEYLADADYIDFHTSQTGHGIEKCYVSDDVMNKMSYLSTKPYMDSEPRYEDHPACFNDHIGHFWSAIDVRQNAYWNVLSGACGHTYGNHCIWIMNREPSSYFPYKWQEALLHEGAEQIAHVKSLRLSRDYYSLRPAPQLIVNNYSGMGHMVGAIGDGYAYVYSPLGVPFTVRLNQLNRSSQVRALWFNPRTGEEDVFSIFPAVGESLVVPPTQGRGCDWVLILEAV